MTTWFSFPGTWERLTKNVRGGKQGKFSSQSHSRGGLFFLQDPLKYILYRLYIFFKFSYCFRKKLFTSTRNFTLNGVGIKKGFSYLQKLRMADCLISHQPLVRVSDLTSTLKIKCYFFPRWVKLCLLKHSLQPRLGEQVLVQVKPRKGVNHR